MKENRGLLMMINFSALSFILLPFLGVVIPFVIWVSNRKTINDLDKTGRGILNFQITWTMILFIGYIGIILNAVLRMRTSGDMHPTFVTSMVMMNFLLLAVMYLYNLTMIVINAVRINKDKKVFYTPKIRFIRK